MKGDIGSRVPSLSDGWIQTDLIEALVSKENNSSF